MGRWASSRARRARGRRGRRRWSCRVLVEGADSGAWPAVAVFDADPEGGVRVVQRPHPIHRLGEPVSLALSLLVVGIERSAQVVGDPSLVLPQQAQYAHGVLGMGDGVPADQVL